MADQKPAAEQHEDTCDQPMKPEFWLHYWDSEEGRQLNHLEPHECLVKYANKMTQGQKNLKIFVPLCGKSYDMKWLADDGHTVVGVELSPAVIKQFFELVKMDYTVSKVPSVELDLYKSKDGKIRIYAGDFFLFSKDIEGEFDAVWDSAALHSLPKPERKKYVELVKTLLSTGCQYLLEDDVPSCSETITKKELEDIFGNGFIIDELGFTKTEVDFFKEWEIEGFNIFHIHL